MTAARPSRRLVIVVRADPVICGHSAEARNLAEAALLRGFDDVRIVTWPIETLGALPLKPLDSVLPYSPGITVERPDSVGDYKVPDGRYTAGMTGRLIELFTDGISTICVSLYLMPHAHVVMEARSVARTLGLPVDLRTVACAVGSDITNVVRSCVEEGRLGAAAHLFTAYLGNDRCVAVSRYTVDLIVDAAESVDAGLGTEFADQCRARIGVSYPAVDSCAYQDPRAVVVERALARRGLDRDGFVLFLSRLAPAKGVDDLIAGFAASAVADRFRLVIAGTGPSAADLRAQAASSGVDHRIDFLADVADDEKRMLMAGSAAYVLPSKPRPEFVETFGIALVEKMLSGGGPVITTDTGGIPEAVGDTATIVPVESPMAIATALEDVLLHISAEERAARADKARKYALQFDRLRVFDGLIGPLLDAGLPADSGTGPSDAAA